MGSAIKSMGKSFFELEQNIRLILDSSSDLVLQSSKINDRVEKYILHTLKLILEKVGRADLLDMTYTITKELAINGIKANQKRIFFEDNGLDILSQEEYARGMVHFRREFSDQMNESYGKKALEKGIYVKITLTYAADGLCLEVENNTPIAPIEERRMREKMKRAMGYNDIAEFYMDNMDNTEGAGLGLALIIILLKGENIDPALFRIFTHDDRTMARVEIPFNDDYVSKRSAQQAEAGLG